MGRPRDHQQLVPGEDLDDERYTERRCDVLAARGRRAWQEHQPVPVRTFLDRGGDGYAAGRIYRRVPRGQYLNPFVLDMRSHRGGNDTLRLPDRGILGAEQERWLVEQVTASRATWKVICADLPISIPSTHDDDLDGWSNGDDGAPRGREPELARVLSAFRAAGVRDGDQLFRHLAVDVAGAMTVTLHDGSGAALWRTTL